MKVLFVNPAGGLGGSERSLLDLIQSLRSTRPEILVSLLALEEGELVVRAREAGAECHVLPLPAALAELGESNAPEFGAAASAFARAAALAPGYLGRFRRRVRELDPTIVHTNGVKAHALAAFAVRDRPLVVHLRDFAGERRISRHLFRMLPARTIVVTNSRAVERDLLELAPDLRTRVIHNAIDTAAFAPGPIDRELLPRLSGLPPPAPGTPSIGIVATYAWWKGQRTFVAAAGHLRRTLPGRAMRFYVVGGSTYATHGSEISEGELRAAIEQAGVVDCVGLVPFRSDIASVYRALDIVVHASTRAEPFGRTIVEAMATGRAVVVSRAGGAVELYEEGRSGLGFMPGDPEDLARVLTKLVEDEALRGSLGERARRHALEHFDRARLGPEIAGVYEELLAITA
jgi:glycosyltransferase involved in cell wall biosynthesis